jgi:hypothetical protein
VRLQSKRGEPDGSRPASGAGHTTAPFACECQSFLDKIIAGSEYFAPTFPSSSPLCPATQSGLCGATSAPPSDQPGRERERFERPPAPLALLPDVPTIAESAVPGFSAAIRYGLVAPARTPAVIVERLSRELRAAVMSEEVRERMLSEGAEPLASTPAEYAAEIDAEERKWSALVKSLNLKME